MKFRHKALRRFVETGSMQGLPQASAHKLERLLSLLAAAKSMDDIHTGFGRLHQLRADRAGEWSFYVTRNWRLVFRFEDGEAVDIDLVDYH